MKRPILASFVLDGTDLSANGQALPILENFLPTLAQEIPWDSFFTGMQAAARARAEAEAAAGSGEPDAAAGGASGSGDPNSAK